VTFLKRMPIANFEFDKYKHMKNKKSLLIGILITLIFIFFVSGILQYLVVSLLGVSIEEVAFSASGITPIFNVSTGSNIYLNVFILFSKLFISISFLELGLLLLSKFPIGAFRFTVITSILSLIGYLILTFFYGIISTLVSASSISNFAKLIQLLELEENQGFALLFFLLIIFVGYLHLVQKRVMQYLSVDKLS